MTAALVYVAYDNDSIDVSWIPTGVGAQVVVVHNDGSRGVSVDGAGSNVDVVHLDPGRNLGFGGGVNAAVAHATRTRLVLVNPDTRLKLDHWEALVRDAGEDEVVTIPLHDESGVATTTTSRYPSPLRHMLGGFRAGRLAPRGSAFRDRVTSETAAGAYPLATHWASGAVLSIARSRFTTVGGFDEGYFLYYEDIDLCRRLAARFPSMTVKFADVPPGVHTVGVSASNAPDVERIRLRSAVRWASWQSGTAWRVVEWVLSARLRLLEH